MSRPEQRRGIAPAEPLELSRLIDYQEASIVSRTLLESRTGNITLFAFDQGQGLSEHTAPYDALLHIVEGEVEVTVSGVAKRVKAGELFLIPAQAPHSLRALTRFKMVLSMLRA